MTERAPDEREPGHPVTIDAVTVGVTDMDRACAFYETAGFETIYGGPGTSFTTYRVGRTHLNLQLVASVSGGWGRFIVHVDDVDAMYRRLTAAGIEPSTAPADAPWGERYFHVTDPDGHEVSFAKPL